MSKFFLRLKQFFFQMVFLCLKIRYLQHIPGGHNFKQTCENCRTRSGISHCLKNNCTFNPPFRDIKS